MCRTHTTEGSAVQAIQGERADAILDGMGDEAECSGGRGRFPADGQAIETAHEGDRAKIIQTAEVLPDDPPEVVLEQPVELIDIGGGRALHIQPLSWPQVRKLEDQLLTGQHFATDFDIECDRQRIGHRRQRRQDPDRHDDHGPGTAPISSDVCQ